MPIARLHGLDRMLLAIHVMVAGGEAPTDVDARRLCQELHDAADEEILTFGQVTSDPGRTVAALAVTISDETSRILREWPAYQSPTLCEAVRTVAVVPYLSADFTTDDYRDVKPYMTQVRAEIDAAFAELRRLKGQSISKS